MEGGQGELIWVAGYTQEEVYLHANGYPFSTSRTAAQQLQ